MMTKQTALLALCYELALEAAKKWSHIRLFPWFPLLMAYCLPSWTEWKTQNTLKKVDTQAKELVEQWKKEERETVANKLAEKAQELFPQATVTPLPDAIVPSVMIVHEAPEGASDNIKALGKELRITWKLE
jgi:hypothetical protein